MTTNTKTQTLPPVLPLGAEPRREKILWRRCHRRSEKSPAPERTVVTLLRFSETERRWV